MKCMTLTVLCCLAIGRYAGAIDKPPDEPKNQRSWLRDHLVSDLAETNKRMRGTFAPRELERAKAITNPRPQPRFKIGDDDVDRLADYYYRTRTQAEKDVKSRQLPNPKQAAMTDEELKAAEADRDGIYTLGGELADKGDAVKSLSQLIYASLPGYCLRKKLSLPPSYFVDQGNGTLSYSGPAYDTTYAGSYADPIVTYVNDPTRDVSWLRHVYLWRNRQYLLAGGGTGNWRTRANAAQGGGGFGNGGGNVRGSNGPTTNQGGAGTGNRGNGTKRNGTSQ